MGDCAPQRIPRAMTTWRPGVRNGKEVEWLVVVDCCHKLFYHVAPEFSCYTAIQSATTITMTEVNCTSVEAASIIMVNFDNHHHSIVIVIVIVIVNIIMIIATARTTTINAKHFIHIYSQMALNGTSRWRTSCNRQQWEQQPYHIATKDISSAYATDQQSVQQQLQQQLLPSYFVPFLFVDMPSDLFVRWFVVY